jgi:hypothetical protein
MSSMRGLAMIFGPGIFSATFAACIAQGRSFPAGPWYLAAFILLIALVVAWNVTTKSATTSNPQIAGQQAAS